MSEPSPEVIESCTSCGQLLDVSDLAPFSEIDCPNCGTAQRVRKQFNHFEITELLGEGGMGSVFKALDTTLQRDVALKILKASTGSDGADYKKLADEARITASISHPHVVKVFSFGEDRGLFYLAMELVPRGSLDDLMGLQGRVGELQALNVGIQIAQGLQAALDRGLLHRDIKPGNILFADANTAKIVDFGLAVLLDEQAQEQGEIWGTPYYIAPEKLDNRPEDFRSDMYSLGGTLFHAIAGRPPFEAQTASMVALKHIKSQAVSLQAFAPDVSSETAYVINRMLHKDPEGRYASYDELVGHLNYAKQKLVERSKAPIQRKDRGIIESEKSKNLMGLVWGITLLVIIGAGALAFIYSDRLFPEREGASPASTTMSSRELDSTFAAGRRKLAEGNFTSAAADFDLVATNTTSQPLRSWALANQGLALLMDGDNVASRDVFDGLQRAGLYSTDSRNLRLANFFVELGRLMASDAPILSGTIRIYQTDNYDAFAMLAYGMKNWDLGDIMNGGEMLEAFSATTPEPPFEWIADYKPLIQPYLLDFINFRRISNRAKNTPPDRQAALLTEIDTARADSRTGSRIHEAYDRLAEQIRNPGAAQGN